MICRTCPRETPAKDGYCRGCRLKAYTRTRQKYFWTAELDAKLRRAYQAKNKRLAGVEIAELVRRTGWPRFIFQNRATVLGLRLYTAERWEPAEIEAIRELAGSVPAYKIAKEIGRSKSAVRNKLFTIDMESRVTEGFSVNELSKLLGTRHAKIERWIGRGWLSLSADDRVTHPSVARFVWEHMDEYRFAACEEWWLKTMLNPRMGVVRQGPRSAKREEAA